MADGFGSAIGHPHGTCGCVGSGAKSMLDCEKARWWCEALARVTPRTVITSPEGAPYLERYYVAGYNPANNRHPASTSSVFLHHFVSSDPNGVVHSHPWSWALSIILVGGYREYRCFEHAQIARTFEPGMCNVLESEAKHRIELLEDDCWTLFLAGKTDKPWNFFERC